MASPSQDPLYVFLRVPFRDLHRIAPSSVVDIFVQYHIHHAPTISLSQPTTGLGYPVSVEINWPSPRNSWNIHQEQLFYLNMSGHAARNSYPDYNSTINPMHVTSSLNPHATHFQEIDHHLIVDDLDVAEEFENRDWLLDDVQETATAPDSIVVRNRSRDEDIYEDFMKTRKSREEDEVESNICVVCQDDLHEKENDNETIATLHCGHEYHMHCIKNWMKIKNVCPLCNSKALPQH